MIHTYFILDKSLFNFSTLSGSLPFAIRFWCGGTPLRGNRSKSEDDATEEQEESMD